MRFAIDFPLDVRGLVLVATSSRVGRTAADWYRQRVEMVQRGDPQLRETLDRDTADVHSESPDELEEALMIRRQSTADPRGYGNACAAMAALNAAPLDPELGRITVPTLIIASEKDRHWRPRSSPRASRAAGSRSSPARDTRSRSRSPVSLRLPSTPSWPKLPETLRREWGDHDILTLTIDRPERRNALDPELLSALAEALFTEGDRAGAVILRGAGTEAFSSGYDLSLLTGTVDDLDADRHIGEAASALRACPAPVIARLQGHCHGAAVEIALNCDLRIAADDLRLSVPAVSLGVVYRFQFVARLVQICGLARATDLLLAMPELDAETAHRWGLVTEVVSASKIDDRVQALAETLAASPRPAVQGTKVSLNLLERRAIAGEDLLQAQQLRAGAAASPERREAVARRKQSMSRRSRTEKK
jgi:enoyl-CoA hydratase/carnithine racemase